MRINLTRIFYLVHLFLSFISSLPTPPLQFFLFLSIFSFPLLFFFILSSFPSIYFSYSYSSIICPTTYFFFCPSCALSCHHTHNTYLSATQPHSSIFIFHLSESLTLLLIFILLILLLLPDK